MANLNQSTFQRNYELTPIILVGGIASNAPDGMTSVLTILGGEPSNVNDTSTYFAHFKPAAGGSLEQWGVAEYPFVSLEMAANAVVQNQLTISMMMYCPAQTNGNGYASKNSVITNMKTLLDTHILQGGTFTVATPAYTYENCILVSLKDVTGNDSKQVQTLYQWDFVKPLVTQAGATASYNTLMKKMAGGLPTPTTLNWSGQQPAIGFDGGNGNY